MKGPGDLVDPVDDAAHLGLEALLVVGDEPLPEIGINRRSGVRPRRSLRLHP
jgi:hypothetical protein